MDWAQLFELAGLDIEEFDEVPPQLQPPSYADTLEAQAQPKSAITNPDTGAGWASGANAQPVDDEAIKAIRDIEDRIAELRPGESVAFGHHEVEPILAAAHIAHAAYRAKCEESERRQRNSEIIDEGYQTQAAVCRELRAEVERLQKEVKRLTEENTMYYNNSVL